MIDQVRAADRLAQIQLAELRVHRLHLEARTTAGPERLTAICDELQLIYDGLCEVREQQIMESLPKPKPKRKRWWRRGCSPIQRKEAR